MGIELAIEPNCLDSEHLTRDEGQNHVVAFVVSAANDNLDNLTIASLYFHHVEACEVESLELTNLAVLVVATGHDGMVAVFQFDLADRSYELRRETHISVPQEVAHGSSLVSVSINCNPFGKVFQNFFK